MTYEESQLIYHDLCSRVPYGVAYRFKSSTAEDPKPHFLDQMNGWTTFFIQQGYIMAYLRPLSSMSEEERKEFWEIGGVMTYDTELNQWLVVELSLAALEFVNRKHLDYNNLIPKGLALVAPEDMYKD